MAKRNKAKFAAKSRKSALRVEALEQRQLLAAVTGGGTQVGSDIVHPNGNVYDQVLMTGASVTVTADPGQVTRVSFLDLQGDIVQAEFSGAGSLTIQLDQFKAAAEATTYNQPGVKYVQGLATFTIQGENSTTNFSAFSVGSGNAINQSLFAGGKTGGNHLADVARLLIVADTATPGGSTMGGIRMGNAVFSDSANVVGISAANVQTQGPVIIGDIDATNAGVPTLKFGTNSQFATLTVAGGDLLQTNAQVVQGSGFSSVNSTAGADSTVESRPGFTTGAPNIGSKVIAAGTVDVDPNTAGVQNPQVVTLEIVTSFDLTGKTQADIDAAFKGRTFTNDITINGNLSGVNNLSAAEFRGAVTFAGTLTGNVSVDGAVKSLTFANANSAAITAASIGSITTTGTADLSGTITAKSIGAVTVGGNLTGTITTDADGSGTWTSGEKAVGDITVASNFSGSVTGVLGIGNVTVGGNLTTSTTALKTISGTSGDAFLGNVGKITVTGDVSQGAGALINIAGNGTFGDINVLGGGTNTSSHTVGTITVNGQLGGAGTAAGKITVTDNMATGSTLTLGAISIGAGSTSNNGSLGSISVTNTTGSVASSAIGFTGTGSVGDVTLTGGGSGASATLGAITLSTGTGGVSLGNVTVSGARTVTLGAIAGNTMGNLSVTASGGTNAATISASTISTTGSMGNLTLNASTVAGSKVTIGGNITTSNTASNSSGTIGTISLTAGADLANNIAINGNIQAGKIGAVTHTGTTTFAANTGYKALGGLTSFTTTDSTAFNTSAGAVDATATSSATAFTLAGSTLTLGQNVAVAGGTGGSAYLTAPTVTLTGGTTTGTAATAVAVLTNGAVSGIEITNAGTGYTVAPTGFTISGGTHVAGSGAGSATPNIQVGGTSGAFTFGGSTTFTGGGGSTGTTSAAFTAATNVVNLAVPASNIVGGANGNLQGTITVPATGSGYATAPTVTLSVGTTDAGGGNTVAGITGTALLNGTGQVTGVSLSPSGTIGTSWDANDTINITFTANTGTVTATTAATGTAQAGGTVPAILANNGGSALDSIASLTFNGTVTGVAGKIDVRASQIGDITVTKALATNESLVKDFGVYAGNNGATSAGSAEKVSVDGSNLSLYKIGNISITSTNTIGVSGTALLAGSNSFNAIGQIGNVTLSAGGSAAVQTSLFQGASGNSLLVQVGNGNVSSNAIANLGSGIDFEGNGAVGGTMGNTTNGFDSTIVASTETSSVFSTSSTVSIGNITINATRATATDSVSGLGQAAGTFTDGLVILSGAKAATDYKIGTASDVTAINSTNLRGTVGNVSVTNLSQQLSVQGPYTTPATTLTQQDQAALIVAVAGGSTVSPYGTIQGVAATTAGLDATNKTVLLGNNGTANQEDPNELLIVRL